MNRMIVERPDIGRIELDWRDDWDKNQTYYQVKALRVSGTITVAAEIDELRHDPLDPETCRVKLSYGVVNKLGEQDIYSRTEREDRLTVNGVVLRGDTYVPPPQLRKAPLTQWCAPPWAPAKTKARTAAVLTAVAGHWITRDPHYLLFRLATVAAAAPDYAAKLAKRVRQQEKALAHAHRELDDMRDKLNTAETWQRVPRTTKEQVVSNELCWA